MSEIGIVLSGVEPLRVKALIFNEVSIPVWNRLVKIPCGKNRFLVGVITHYQGINSLYEAPEMAKKISSILDKAKVVKLLKQRKEHLIADIAILSAFEESAKGLRRSKIDRVEVGSYIYRLTNDDLRFCSDYSYIGRFYDEELLQPLYIKDFQSLGEAYHFVVAGQTGSGKSTLVMMLLCLYAKAGAKSGNPMNFLILTPVPEFTRAFKEGSTSFGLNIKKVFENLGYKIEVYSVEELSFDRYEVLEELLEKSKLFSNLLMIRHHENRATALALLMGYLRNNANLQNLLRYVDNIIDYMKTDGFVERVYKTEGSQQNLRNILEDVNMVNEIKEELSRVFSRFDTEREAKRRIADVIKSFVYGIGNSGRNGRVLVLDINSGGNRVLQNMVLREVVNEIRRFGEDLYVNNPELNLNTLVVLEEAHNFVSSRVPQDDDKLKALKEKLVRSYAETRKFGIGWMSITTRLSLIDRHIYEHSRVKIIGYGLATGQDREILREDFGSNILDRYIAMADPTDPLNEEREHSFLISGPITILSRYEPEFVQVFSTTKEFLQENNLIEEF